LDYPARPGLRPSGAIINEVNMKILFLDNSIEHKNVETAAYRSSLSMLDYDSVVWDPNSILDSYGRSGSGYEGTYMGYPSLNDDSSVHIISDFERRKNEITEFLKLGRTIFIFMPVPNYFHYATGEKRYSGTGRNQQTTRIVTKKSIFDALPIDIQTVKATGTNITVLDDSKFNTFFKFNADHFYYDAYLKSDIGKPLAVISNTSKVVSSMISFEKGTIILLPRRYDKEDYDTAKAYKDQCTVFVESLINYIKDIQDTSGDYSIPEWASLYKLPGENEIQEKIRKASKKLDDQLRIVNSLKEKDKTYNLRKILFTGTGKALENKCRDIFNELGFAFKETAANRDDFILNYAKNTFVVEIKGLTGSAAEKNAAQLEKWASEYTLEHGSSAKPLLIINTFREKPLLERKGKNFPDQMIKYCSDRNHCLLTTLQLLGIYIDVCVNRSINMEQVIELLISTKGVFEKYGNYNDYIVYESINNSES
jgi:hypothetical protein